MANPVLSALLPVVLLIAIGYAAGRAGWIRAEATKDLSNLVFMVLTPALLFRTMSTVHVEQLNFKPVAMYFVAAMLLFGAMLVWQGGTRRAAVLALAVTGGNTLATVVLELAVAREDAQSGGGGRRPMMLTVLAAVRNGIIHPVPLPIIAGLLFAQTGLVMPVVVERPLQLLGNAFGRRQHHAAGRTRSAPFAFIRAPIQTIRTQ